jgi:hypothetical protein
MNALLTNAAAAWSSQTIGLFRVTHLHSSLVVVRQELTLAKALKN